jgi:hypothetical protein
MIHLVAGERVFTCPRCSHEEILTFDGDRVDAS